ALVKDLALSAGVPFIVALFGTLIVLWFGIPRGLAPLERIRVLLARRRPDDDSPLPKVKAPIELQPLLHTIEQLLEKLQAAIIRERRFTDSAAHELRTPLTGVKTHIQVAKLASRRQDEKATLDAALTGADEGVQQLQNIVQRLLELARLEVESIQKEVSEPLAAVEAAIEAVQLLHDHPGGKVQVLGAEVSRPVRVARPLLLAALQNLLDNAIRYAPSDSAIVIQIAAPGDGTLQISVMDAGPGMDEEQRSLAV